MLGSTLSPLEASAFADREVRRRDAGRCAGVQDQRRDREREPAAQHGTRAGPFRAGAVPRAERRREARGAIVRVLRDAGHAVIASDIHLYDFPLHFTQDFLATTKAPEGTEMILTNPPYRYAAEFGKGL